MEPMVLNIRNFSTFGLFGLLALTAMPTHASLVQINSIAGLPTVNDRIDWASVGGDLTALTPPVALTTAAGHAATMSGSTAFSLFSGSTFNADFLPGDTVASAFDLNSFTALATGIRINLSFLVNGLVTQVQTNAFGPFVATLEVFDINSVSLGSVQVTSSVSGNGDGSAAYLGAYSTGTPIASMLFTADVTGVAINNVQLDAVPEPSTFVLAFLAIAVLGVIRRRPVRVSSPRAI